MAKRYVKTHYTAEFTYLNIKDNVMTKIKNESVKSIIIDHNYDKNCMPIMYVNLSLDKSLIDHMIQNANTNLIAVVLYKYDELTNSKEKIECFRNKFTYFLNNSINKNDPIDYNKATEEQYRGDTYMSISIGLLCVDHVNRNKRTIEFSVNNTSMSSMVSHVLSGFNPLIMNPLFKNDTLNKFVMQPKDSVNSALRFLNNYRVFYQTPYRFYQDWNCTYLLDSSGKSVKTPGERYSSVVVNIKEIPLNGRIDVGYLDNRNDGVYEVPVNYVDTDILDNTIINKSRNRIRGINNGSDISTGLKYNASYSTNKTINTRINFDNNDIISNMKADSDNNTFFIFFTKEDIDTSIFTINKKITVNNIDRYNSHNGNYLLSRKRELYVRTDDTFDLTSMINLRKIG